MLAVFIDGFDRADPTAAIRVGERPEPIAVDDDDDWTVVEVRASSVNRHDLFAAAGGVIGADMLPRILGMDAAGVCDDGREVLVHNLINSPNWTGPPLLDPQLTGLSEGYDGTFAERVLVPRANLVSKPASMTFEEAACLPTAWLTAYRMLFVSSHLRPGDVVLVQGAAGGVATALIMLGSAAGLCVWVTSRDERRRAHATSLGASETFPTGARLPGRADAVMDTVGAPTWEHSLRSVRKGGTVVVGGGTGGYQATTDLARIFVNSLRIVGSAMGTQEELEHVVSFVAAKHLHPPISHTLPLQDASDALSLMERGDVVGKVILRT